MSFQSVVIRVAVVGSFFAQSAACAQGRRVDVAAREPMSTVGDSALAVHQFVQGFYDWYTPIAVAPREGFAYYRVLSKSDSYLDLDLAAALRGDSVAQFSIPDTRQTLNFDPFLNTQDPCAPTEVVGVRRQGGTSRVTIRTCRASRPGPVVEVRAVNGRWRITNVFYGRGDLRSYLCQWAKEDTRTDKRPDKC